MYIRVRVHLVKNLGKNALVKRDVCLLGRLIYDKQIEMCIRDSPYMICNVTLDFNEHE